MNFYLFVTDVVSFSFGIFIPNYKTALASHHPSHKIKTHKVLHKKVNLSFYKTYLKRFGIIVCQILRISNPQDIKTTNLTLNKKNP